MRLAAYGETRKVAMTSELSLSQLMTNLEAQLAACREKVAYHAELENRHRGERERYAAESETLQRTLEMLQTVSAQAIQLAGSSLSQTPLPPEDTGGGKVPIAKMVARVLELRESEEPFGVSAIAEAVNRRYRNRLKKPVERRQVSVVLRWMLRTGRLRSVQRGRPFHEALYAKA